MSEIALSKCALKTIKQYTINCVLPPISFVQLGKPEGLGITGVCI